MTDKSASENGTAGVGVRQMPQISIRLTDRMLEQLDALAAERRITRTRAVRQLLEAGLRDRPAPVVDSPTEEELVALLTERARAGNVSAIRSLLERERTADPRMAALAAFEQVAKDRFQ